MAQILENIRALGPARLIALALALGVAAFSITLLSVYATREPMALLYGDLDLREASSITAQLDKQRVPYELRMGGHEILIPANQVSRARIMLAREGLPSGGTIGYEIFDNENSLTATQAQQQINRLRALEGELARTIRSIDGVRNARVHLVLPQRAAFERDPPKAQASVLLTIAGQAGLDRETVRAIAHLVATAVPRLKVEDITIADSRGNLLSGRSSDEGADPGPRAQKLRHTLELQISRSVEAMLERILGPGNVRADTTLELNVARIHEITENFDPNGQVVRSSQTKTVTSDVADTGQGAATVQNNLPNADAAQSGSRSREQRQDEITNYEITKTVRDIVREQALIQRLSLAVLINGTYKKNPDGSVVWEPRTKEEIDRITNLLKAAVGFDARRGDQITVESMEFRQDDIGSDQKPKNRWESLLNGIDLVDVGRVGIPVAVALIALFFVVRPAVNNLLLRHPEMSDDSRQFLEPSATTSAETIGQNRLPANAEPDKSSLPEPSELELQIENVSGTIRAAAVRKVTALVERHPEESLSIVRSWLQQESG